MTERERYQLEAYLRVGKPKAWIARIMGFCRQTIYNETRRGEAHVIRLEHGYYYDRQEYSADKAQQIHDYNQTAKGRPIKLGNHYDYARRLEDLMLGVQPDGKIDRRKRYSPYAALAIAGKEGYPISICTSTLYSYIDKGVFLHLANKDLWQKWRRRKRKYHPIQRVAHAHLPSIEARPQTINDRAEPGHWEMDLVVGKAQSKPALLTLTERQSRREVILKIPDKKAASVINALSQAAPSGIKTITTDNGSEFLYYGKLRQLLHGGQIYYCHSYHKSALSVIESTVYAHDAEKKWVQSHPAILYEMETIKSAMSELTNKFTTDTDLNPLFCYEAITEEGKTLKLSTPLFSGKGKKLEASDKLWSVQAKALDKKNQLFADRSGVNANLEIEREYPIALLADEDFLHLMKLFCKDSLGYEYFARDKRRSAVWKSEAEFRALFQKRIGDTTDSIVGLEKDFEELAKYCQDKTGTPIVNDVVFEILDQEDADAKKALDDGEIDKDDYDDIISGDGTKRHWAKILIGLAEKLNLEHDFMIIFQKKFSSSFKATVGDIPIYFPNVEGGVVPLGKVVTTLSPTAERKSNFFHIFFKPIGEVNDKRKKTIVNTIAKELIRGIE